MKFHACTRGLLAGAIGVAALAGSCGVASAEPDVVDPGTVPPIITQIITGTPAFIVDPRDRDGPRSDLGGTRECSAKICGLAAGNN
jgi:hypothetical protein